MRPTLKMHCRLGFLGANSLQSRQRCLSKDDSAIPASAIPAAMTRPMLRSPFLVASFLRCAPFMYTWASTHRSHSLLQPSRILSDCSDSKFHGLKRSLSSCVSTTLAYSMGFGRFDGVERNDLRSSLALLRASRFARPMLLKTLRTASGQRR